MCTRQAARAWKPRPIGRMVRSLPIVPYGARRVRPDLRARLGAIGGVWTGECKPPLRRRPAARDRDCDTTICRCHDHRR